MLLFDRAGDIWDYDLPSNVFLIDPWIPMKSIVLLYGKPSVGKTPLLWAMAEAIHNGGKFLGVQAQQGNALILDFDMPDVLVRKRLMDGDFRPSFVLGIEPNRIDSLQLIEGAYCDARHRAFRETLLELQAKYDFSFVGIDALREVVKGEIVGTGLADRVYAAWRGIFPNASICLNHHETKALVDPMGAAIGDPLDRAKGSAEFTDIAQVALRLAETKKGVYLTMTKSQASEKGTPIRIVLQKGLVREDA